MSVLGAHLLNFETLAQRSRWPLPKAPGPSSCCPGCRQAAVWKHVDSDHVTVVVQGGDIVVSLAGFYADYYKPTNEPQLKLRHRTDTNDHARLARSWQAANQKARELGWIV